jgi:hypothetical protein
MRQEWLKTVSKTACSGEKVVCFAVIKLVKMSDL